MKTIRFRPVLALLLVALALLGNSCSNDNEQVKKPNILWITSEDNSVHFLRLFDPNGAPAPNIERLAEDGLTFTRAFSNAPVCSVARSTLISGCYTPRIGAQFHRKSQKVPMPDGLKMFPAYLREAGYYTSNNSKEDYNIIKGDDVWDESSRKASWRKRAEGQPFFHVQNIGVCHESSLHFSQAVMDSVVTKTDPETVFIAPNHPDTELFRYTYARYHDRMMEMDRQVGRILEKLEEDGLLEETIIFYYGDHGGVLPGSKSYLYEVGLHVPLVIRIPEKYKNLSIADPGSEVAGFVSFVDFGATVLKLAGIDTPEAMDGKPFLGKGISQKELKGRNTTFGYSDRFDEKYDMARSMRQGSFKYIRSYAPYQMDGLQNNYRYKMLAYAQWRDLFKAGKLNEAQSLHFLPRAPETLYDLESDPYELTNLAQLPEYADKLEEMRTLLDDRLMGMPDLSFYPEHYLMKEAADNPVQFGEQKKEEIAELINVANYQLQPFDEVAGAMEQALDSSNPWIRYWGLISCSAFGEDAGSLADEISKIAMEDTLRINRVKAAEFLALTALSDPGEVIAEALSGSDDNVEIMEILNTMALLKDLGTPVELKLPGHIISKGEELQVIQSRIDYLTNKL